MGGGYTPLHPFRVKIFTHHPSVFSGMARVKIGSKVSTHAWRFNDPPGWAREEYGSRYRTTLVYGKVTKRVSAGMWFVEWDINHPDPKRREGESKRAHLTIVQESSSEASGQDNRGNSGRPAHQDDLCSLSSNDIDEGKKSVGGGMAVMNPRVR